MAGRARIASMDILRGGAMVFMVLDHVRGWMHQGLPSPTAIATTTPALFVTRWLSHFVAPAFILLAGIGAYLYGTRPGRTLADTRQFLWTRGVWLIIVEFTLVHTGWFMDLDLRNQFAQVIWAIGLSMLVLAAAAGLPRRVVLGAGLVVCLFQGFLPPSDTGGAVAAADVGSGQAIWMALYDGGTIYWGPADDWTGFLNFFYPALPWIGLMLVGYGIGPTWTMAVERRARILYLAAAACAALFLVLRATNVYGDPQPWASSDRGALYTTLSFFNLEKYPPSVDFLLATTSVMLALLPVLEKARGWLADLLATVGRVPFFFYIIHLWVIQSANILLSAVQGIDPAWVFGQDWWSPFPAAFGGGLVLVYVVSLAVFMMLVPLCTWFARVKREHPEKAWLSYL